MSVKKDILDDLSPAKRLALKMDEIMTHLSDYIEPESDITKDEVIHRILGVVDNRETNEEIRAVLQNRERPRSS